MEHPHTGENTQQKALTVFYFIENIDKANNYEYHSILATKYKSNRKGLKG